MPAHFIDRSSPSIEETDHNPEIGSGIQMVEIKILLVGHSVLCHAAEANFAA